MGWISAAKGSQLSLYQALPQEHRGDNSSAADCGHDLALVLGAWAGLGTKGFVLPVPFPGTRNSPQRNGCTRSSSAGRDPGHEV